MGKKVALVTGGARGIGKATAQALALRGYEVAVADLDAAAGRKSEFLFLRCDVSSEASVRACVRAMLQRFGRLDALVNNAGLAGPVDPPVERLTLARWNRRIGVNLTEAYSASKGGLVALTHALAISLGPRVQNFIIDGGMTKKMQYR